MSVQTVKLGGRDYVIVLRNAFRELEERVKGGQRSPRKPRRPTAQDCGDIAEATRRLNDPNDREIPCDQARKRLGLT